jgi:hypothetical protein
MSHDARYPALLRRGPDPLRSHDPNLRIAQRSMTHALPE